MKISPQLPCFAKWFMSYCYTTGTDDKVKFACVTYSGDEHPVAKVRRWNQGNTLGDITSRHHVLLHFHEFTTGENIPEIDCSCG